MTLCCKIKNFYYATALDYDTACTLNSARLACIGNWYENLSNTCQLQNTTWFTPNWHPQVSCSKGSGKEAGYEGPPHVGEEWTICGGPHHPPRLLSPFRKHSMSQWALILGNKPSTFYLLWPRMTYQESWGHQGVQGGARGHQWAPGGSRLPPAPKREIKQQNNGPKSWFKVPKVCPDPKGMVFTHFWGIWGHLDA